MQRSSFFNAVYSDGTPDRAYMAEDIARYFASFIGTGIYANPVSNLQVKSNNYMTISVLDGRAWINGYFYENTSTLDLTIEMADALYNRIDRVVCRLDLTAREITIALKKGTPSASPIAPILTRNGDIYELALADIEVTKGSTVITNSKITDLRMNTSLCGVVASVVNQIDTTNLFAQYDDAFKLWFDSVKDLFQGDIAGNLNNEITKIKDGTTIVGDSNKLGGKVASDYALKHDHPYLPTTSPCARLSWQDIAGVGSRIVVDNGGNNAAVSYADNAALAVNATKVNNMQVRGGAGLTGAAGYITYSW